MRTGAKMRVDERNANWFAVEAKSFEITMDGEGKKTKYVITERSRGKVSWIRFGEEGLFNLMKNGSLLFRRFMAPYLKFKSMIFFFFFGVLWDGE